MKTCKDCGIEIHELASHTGYEQWCEDCFDKGLKKDMDNHFAHTVEAETNRNLWRAFVGLRSLLSGSPSLFSVKAPQERLQKFKEYSAVLGIKDALEKTVAKVLNEMEVRIRTVPIEDGMWCRNCGGPCDLVNCGMEQP